VMEIWNLVFIQYNRDSDGTLTPLPAKHVDTGMGFERMCAVLQNKESNYDTDVFTPLIGRISAGTGKPYDGRMTGIEKGQLDVDTAMRVIADHIRALTFAIGDGAIPSNEGRGYVLRRLLRRASRFGRNLDVHEPFVCTLVPTLVETMGSVFPEIREKQELIQRIIKGEEESFNATLDRGLERFEQVVQQIGHSKTFPGEDAFRLYDTYGFPLDLTELMSAERGLRVDVAMFTELMEKQRERSRITANLNVTLDDTTLSSTAVIGQAREALEEKHEARAFDTSQLEDRFQFVGYDQLETQSAVLSSRKNLLILDVTPFYGEAGGQIGDQGELRLNDVKVRVLDTQKSGNVNVHILETPLELEGGLAVNAKVDAGRRHAIMRNHTATHLVHAALRQILGTHVHQAGSLVAPDYLRFDFAHFAKVGDAELSDIESLVNEKIKEDIKLSHYRNIPFEQAKKMGALMFFGDKYGDRVNVVEFSEFSREFCGGTHVKSTAEIGYFKFRSEGSVASGIRRIEAVTAEHALELLRLQDRNATERIEYAEGQLQQTTAIQRQLGEQSAGNALTLVRKKLDALKSSPKAPERVTLDLQGHFTQRAQRGFDIEGLVLEIAEIKRTLEKVASKQRLQSQSGLIENLVQHATLINGLKVVSSRVEASTLDELKMLGDTLRARLGSGVGLLASVLDDKVSLVCVVTDDLVAGKRLEAGKVVGAVARIVGGGGGGKAHLATAGGKDVSKLAEALRATETVVKSFLRN